MKIKRTKYNPINETGLNAKDLEMLSAYADGELSAKEAVEIEQKLKLSPELQQELIKLKKLKSLTLSSAKRPAELPYFESRLMAKLNSEKTSGDKIKRWFPAIAIGSLTIFLMIFLKYNPGVIDEIVEEQKTNIAGFYSENLKPLLFAADLTNEDIFNFAFSNKLPLDNSDSQVIQLGYSDNGEEFFEIKTAGFSSGEQNYENFARALKVNPAEKKQMDSILESYKDEIETQLLVNENHTLAINPNLWNYNKAIAADLIAFAKDVNQYELAKLVPVDMPLYNQKNVRQIVTEVKAAKPHEFIFVTPDSIFSEEFVFNKQQFKNEMKQMKEELRKADQQLKHSLSVSLNNINKNRKDSSWNKNFKVDFDSNFCRVMLTQIDIPEIIMPHFEEMAANIEAATKQIQSFVVTVPRAPKVRSRVSVNVGRDSLNSYDFNFEMPMRVDSLIRQYNKNFNFNGNFNLNLDSLVSGFNYNLGDSLHFLQNQEFRKQIKEFEKEMEKFKYEMENLKRDLRKDTVKVIKKKSIEI